jgi:hypothetical protein
MAFSADELNVIERTVGEFCRQIAPPEPLSDQIRIIYEVDRHAVVIFDERLDADGEWSRMPIARFRYLRTQDDWTLYWMRASGEWDYYEGPRKRLSTLVRMVGDDEYGCFFG